jgi:hypothetical protein
MAKIETEPTIYQAFVQAQMEFNKAIKSATNPHLKSKYADLGSVLDAVTPALYKNDLALLQVTHEFSGGVCVETLILHTSGSQLSGGKLSVPATKQDPQGYGSALTYARRYSLMATLGVATEDDDGHSASQPYKPKQQQAKPASQPVAQPTQPALTEQQAWRNDALAWITNALQTKEYKEAWNGEAIRVLLGKTSGEATEAELGALMATMQALPWGGDTITEYHNHLGGTA